MGPHVRGSVIKGSPVDTFFLQQHRYTIPDRVNQITIGRDQRPCQRCMDFSAAVIPDFATLNSCIDSLKIFATQLLQRTPGNRATQYFEQSGVNLAHFDPVGLEQQAG
jgi:hypothetical protein